MDSACGIRNIPIIRLLHRIVRIIQTTMRMFAQTCLKPVVKKGLLLPHIFQKRTGISTAIGVRMENGEIIWTEDLPIIRKSILKDGRNLFSLLTIKSGNWRRITEELRCSGLTEAGYVRGKAKISGLVK